MCWCASGCVLSLRDPDIWPCTAIPEIRCLHFLFDDFSLLSHKENAYGTSATAICISLDVANDYLLNNASKMSRCATTDFPAACQKHTCFIYCFVILKVKFTSFLLVG